MAKNFAEIAFTDAVKRGLPSEDDINNFLSAGYIEENILGVISGIGV